VRSPPHRGGDHAAQSGAVRAVAGADLLHGAPALWLWLAPSSSAIALVLVYVGAVMVLFLFVVMMLDIKTAARCAKASPPICRSVWWWR
jgi:NADH:ubiquinone oxidoreductase subunit 6 (subunit J)